MLHTVVLHRYNDVYRITIPSRIVEVLDLSEFTELSVDMFRHPDRICFSKDKSFGRKRVKPFVIAKRNGKKYYHLVVPKQFVLALGWKPNDLLAAFVSRDFNGFCLQKLPEPRRNGRIGW